MIVVCASGASIWDDLDKVPGYVRDKWEQGFEFMAVNDMGMHLPYKLSHWYSNDSWLTRWRQARRPRFSRGGELKQCYLDEETQYHTCFDVPGCKKWDWHGGGTSALGAVYVALQLTKGSVYVCGAPLDSGPHYFDPPWTKTNFERSGGLRMWQDARDRYFGGRVFSMSGNTKRITDGENIV